MSQKPKPKTAYTPPRMVVYGDIRVLTESMRMTGTDGSTTTDNRFS